MINPLPKILTALFEDLKRYLVLRLEVFKLTALESAARLIADLISNTIMVFFAWIAFLAGAVTLAFYFSALFGSYAVGFGAATAFFILLALLLVWKKSAFEGFIAVIAIRRYFEKHCEAKQGE